MNSKYEHHNFIINHLFDFSFRSISRFSEIAVILPKVLEEYQEILDKTPRAELKLKMALDPPKALGVDVLSLQREDPKKLVFEAAFVMILSMRPETSPFLFQTIDVLLVRNNLLCMYFF